MEPKRNGDYILLRLYTVDYIKVVNYEPNQSPLFATRIFITDYVMLQCSTVQSRHKVHTERGFNISIHFYHTIKLSL